MYDSPYAFVVFMMTAGWAIAGTVHFVTFALLPARWVEWIDV